MAIERNHTPIIAPTILGGASFVTIERPTGLKHSSPIVCKKYKPMSHHGLTSTPGSCAILAAGMIRANPSPTKINPSANFTGLEGCRGPRRIQSHANSGARPKIMNIEFSD